MALALALMISKPLIVSREGLPENPCPGTRLPPSGRIAILHYPKGRKKSVLGPHAGTTESILEIGLVFMRLDVHVGLFLTSSHLF